MPLEATMFCLDNSDWMRNGDYNPTRLASQNDTVHSLANGKIRDNSESAVGFLTMAGTKVNVHLSPCRDMGKMLNALKALTSQGVCNLVDSLKIAQLTLKNRQNKTQRQRIVLFIGSPIACTSDELVAAGKQLKKNNVAIDIVNFGTENGSNDNTEKLEALLASVNNADNSHLVTVPPGPHRLADMVLCSAVCNTGNTGGSGRVGGAVSSGSGVGVSAPATHAQLSSLEETDPELALALRMSLEDAGVSQPTTTTTPAKPTTTTAAAVAPVSMNDDDYDEDAEIAAAIAMSLQMEQQEQQQSVEATPAPTTTTATPAAPQKTDSAPVVSETPGPTKNLSAELEKNKNSDLIQDLINQGLDQDEIDELLAVLEAEKADKDESK